MTRTIKTSVIAAFVAVIGIGAGRLRESTDLTNTSSNPEGWKIFAVPSTNSSSDPVAVAFDKKPGCQGKALPQGQELAPIGNNLLITDQSAGKAGPPAVSVPLPNAAWTSLTGLIGLALVAYWRKVIRIFA